MKIWGAAIALSMMFAAAPAKAAEYITYQGFSSGIAVFYNGFSTELPTWKETGYAFTFVIPRLSGDNSDASITDTNLFFRHVAAFDEFRATACLAQPSNGLFPTSDPALVSGCGSTSHSFGKTVGFQFSGNLFALKAQSSFGVPASTGLVSYSFFDLPNSAVPEPATWFMMLLGIGMVGGAMRRRRRLHIATA